MKSLRYILLSGLLVTSLAACDKASNSSSPSASYDSNTGSGKGGSLARFTIAQNHMYVVDNSNLLVYSLSNPGTPTLVSTQIVGFNIETIYSYKDKLFIGSSDAMYIYSISDAAHPDRMGSASHVRSCDPVVANDTVAYVTVRGGSTCGGSRNSLFVYDVKNILNPVQRNVIDMQSPWGLGMWNNILYVCDGANGLKIYNISSKYSPYYVGEMNDDTYYDVIPLDDMLVCMVQGGVLLYEIKPNGSLVKMAKIVS